MKTATVTWITYNNYGTLLQAYALQQALRKMGIDNKILYDREVLIANKSKISVESLRSKAISRESFFSRLIKLINHPKRIIKIIQSRIARKEYERPYFESQELCETFKLTELSIFYNLDAANLSRLNEEFDLFIAGSDQVWSVFEKNFNPYYFLDFVSKKKIAYAPSLGTNIITKSVGEKISRLLADYSHISVRERETAIKLSDLLQREVYWVVDPTLLHSKKFWDELVRDVPWQKKKYLLCYFLENKEWYFVYAKRLAKKLHLEIVLLPNKWDYISSEYVTKTGVGPKEFVSLIKHSEYVLTDSYHGCIFSLIYERDFQYLLRFSNDDPDSQNIRIQSLFDYLDLNERIISADMKELPFLKIGNYSMLTSKIEVMRNKSQKFLQECFK